MNSVEEYVKRWTKLDKEDFDTLSEGIKLFDACLRYRITRLKRSIKAINPSILNTCDEKWKKTR